MVLAIKKQIPVWMFLEICFVGKHSYISKHLVFFHMVPIDHGIKIGKIRLIGTVQKNRTT